MIEEREKDNLILYCNNCGWKISCDIIEEFYGEISKGYYCYNCGKDLRQIDKEDNLDFLRYCEYLYEDIGSIRAVCRKLEQEGFIVERRSLKRNLARKFEQEGRNFERWFLQFKKYQKGTHYNDAEVDTWIDLYEKIGNLSEISRILKGSNNSGPDSKTIAIRIKQKFEEGSRDFYAWRSHFKNINPTYFLPNYSYHDAKDWKKIYEKQGSYRSVAKIIGVGHHTIKKYISILSDKEEWDLEEWEEKYSINRYKYSQKDVKLWIELYEEIGSFLALSKVLQQNYNQSPDSKNIKKRIKEEFQFNGWDFNAWIKNNEKTSQYSNSDVLEWKNLYEELGNFTAISNYLEEKFGESPDPTTIKNRLLNLFLENGWNFGEWAIINYNDNSKCHYLIGKYIHWILECIFVEYALKHDLKGFFEIMPNRLNGSLKSVDNVLLKSPANTINIDYTISSSKKVFLSKCKKGYQSHNRYLILVSLKRDNISDILKNSNFPFKGNVKIFNIKKFAKYMDYYGNYRENYFDAIKIMKESFTDDFFLKKLAKLAKEAKIKLEKFQEVYPISQEDYELETKWWKKF